jgi:hypothetical protein
LWLNDSIAERAMRRCARGSTANISLRCYHHDSAMYDKLCDLVLIGGTTGPELGRGDVARGLIYHPVAAFLDLSTLRLRLDQVNPDCSLDSCLSRCPIDPESWAIAQLVYGCVSLVDYRIIEGPKIRPRVVHANSCRIWGLK